MYAEHTVKAIKSVVDSFPTLPLHDRLAILAPDAAAVTAMQPALQAKLDEAFPSRFSLVSAKAACSALSSGTEQRDVGIILSDCGGFFECGHTILVVRVDQEDLAVQQIAKQAALLHVLYGFASDRVLHELHLVVLGI